ncbi:imm11 family protein [Paenibacillus cucumis (ex Kampfer et al. 2016)]|uniref:Immunity MXAN-0049 protein domain-containing protein n=1 Tax=Paenibacillus cucumis (ex Kampfer et al. 2016) TaxID=1776858 RepID=A0ABS7KPY4_9BACL|nr:DUF1629 domain-containing protein [Paenibacillus cucumis (ex Kampfer et al. 2016)]MBY0206223.1 hypothetical protein [Paenibacillus cucumis (ex Kampfer et al. 2016)]
MKVYALRHKDSCMEIKTMDWEHELASDFNGEVKATKWTPTTVKTLYKKRHSDFPSLIIGKPIVRGNVRMVLEPLMSRQVEFLPLMHEELKLYVVNVINVLDCVDWNRSDIRTYSDGSWADFNKLVFDFSKIPVDTYMFKIKETATVEVFVTDLFKQVVEEHKFKGLNFNVVYDSEFTQEKEAERQRLYEQTLESIEQNKGKEYTYEDARELVDQGKTMISGRWKMKLDDQRQLWLGELLKDLSYQWIMPMYIPPVLLLESWHEADLLEQ